MIAFSRGWPTARPTTNRAAKDNCRRLMNRYLRSITALQNAPSESTQYSRKRQSNLPGGRCSRIKKGRNGRLRQLRGADMPDIHHQVDLSCHNIVGPIGTLAGL